MWTNKSDGRRLSISTGTKTLHLLCQSKEDRTSWIEVLLIGKDKFSKLSTDNDLALPDEIIVSTEKLRSRLMQDGISEAIVEECESIMQGELALIKNQLEALQIKHIFLLNSLKRLEVQSPSF